MIAIPNYGANNFSSMGYYYLGISNNTQKLLNSGAAVEAGWLAGFNSGSLAGSNLPRRIVNAYSNVTSTLRFNSVIVGIFKNIPCFTMLPLLAPIDFTWKPYA
jgi:hypothetical protein